MKLRPLSPVVLVRLVATALIVAGLVVAWPPGPATAESPDVVGWWNKVKPSLPPELGNPIPPPPDVPQEGFLVANDPSGPAAIAAMRFEATRPRKALLTLHAPDGSSFPPNASMVACPMLSEWDQTSNGAWDRRPELDCATVENPGELTEDGTTVTFQINEEFFRLGVLVNTIEIGIRPEREYVQPFRAPFAKPGPDALVADGPLIEPPGSGGGNGAVAPPPALPPPAPVVPSPGPSDPLVGPLDPGPAVTPEPPADASDSPGVTRPVGQETAAPISAPGSTSDRVLAGALLAALGMGLFLVTTRAPHQPRLIGGLAHRESGGTEVAPRQAGETRGLGRFRRARVPSG